MRFMPRDSRPLLWVDNKVTFSGVRWYCCLLDVSAAKRAERCLHDWLATTSHDARTPLSSIQVSCVLLRERGLLSHESCGANCHGSSKVPEEACDGELMTAISASASVRVDCRA
jgi:K+-sensing histidine kinase KdpD